MRCAALRFAARHPLRRAAFARASRRCSAAMRPPARIVLVPGNGMGGDLDDLRACNFYGDAEAAFVKRGHEVRMSPMPDPLYAKESVWVPHITGPLGADETAVLIGHSSGAGARPGGLGRGEA